MKPARWVQPHDAALRLRQTTAAVLEMERNGVPVDADCARWIAQDAAADEGVELAALRSWFNETTGSRGPLEDADGLWTRHARLGSFLCSGLGMRPSPFWAKGRTKPGEISTDHAAIDWLAGQYPEHRDGLNHLRALRRARGCLKYARKFPRFIHPATGLVHPSFGNTSDEDDRPGALSYRLAVKRPELHQVPRDPRKDVYRLRRMFAARRGETIVVADYSALEVVVLAQLQGWLFNDWQLAGKVAVGAPDIHATTAHDVFSELLDPVALHLTKDQFVAAAKRGEWTDGVALPPRPPERDWPSNRTWTVDDVLKYCAVLRDVTKTIRYGLHYGKGGWGFGNTLFTAAGEPLGEQRATAMVDAFLLAESGLALYYSFVEDWIREHHGIAGLDGGWCCLADLTHDGAEEWQLKRAWRRALNYPMQESGAAIVNLAMFEVAFHPRLTQLGWKLMLQVHDELVLRGPTESKDEAMLIVKTVMESAGTRLLPRPMDIPLQVKTGSGKNWNNAK